MQAADEQAKLAQTSKDKEVNKALKTAAEEKDKVCVCAMCMYVCIHTYVYVYIHMHLKGGG